MSDRRPPLGLKVRELVPADEDRRVEIGVHDLLLPCRWYDIHYTVAELGLASPTLEFLLRLVRSVPGISEDDARFYFGYTRPEFEYVLSEATSPGYAERTKGRLWLTQAGESLFSPGEDGPTIYRVEKRSRSYGFDMLAVAPERRKFLDKVEMALPDLTPEESAETGTISSRLPDRFRRFFRELGDRGDREQAHRKDLYSVDAVVPGERYQVPVRLRIFAQASSPANAEIDLSAWRSDQDLGDRIEVERAANRFISDMRTQKSLDGDAAAYRILTQLAPEFLKDFTISSGLSVERYWREAVTRAGEPRSDRRTVPLVGALCLQDNIERVLKVTDYGTRSVSHTGMIVSVPPRIRHWGSTTLVRDMLTALKVKCRNSQDDDGETTSSCIHVGKAPRYVSATHDLMAVVDGHELPASLELMIVSGLSVAALVHAPIGATSGTPTPLGFASFDPEVIRRVQELVVDGVCRHVVDQDLRQRIEIAMNWRAESLQEAPIIADDNPQGANPAGE